MHLSSALVRLSSLVSRTCPLVLRTRTQSLKECASVLVPIIINIVNLSFSSGQLHPILKESVISPLLKISTSNRDQLSNYRPISNLSLISKIIERVVKSRLTDHLTSTKLLNTHQSAYCSKAIVDIGSDFARAVHSYHPFPDR